MPLLLIRCIALMIALLGPEVATAGTVTTHGPGPGFAIPDDDADGASSSIIIADAGEIQDLDLVLGDLNHTWLGDLIITLTHVDSNTSWNISNRAGQLEGGDESFGFDIDLNGNYTIDDESTSGSFHDQIGFEGDVLPAGDYNSLGSLSNFDGLDIAGTWTLSISDNGLGDTGGLGSWSLLAETPNGSSAGLIFAFEETANGVTGTLSGSLDLANAVSGATTGVSVQPGARIRPASPFMASSLGPGSIDSYLLSVGPTFGPGELSAASSASGDFFQLTSDLIFTDDGIIEVPAIFLPDGYISGTALSATIFFADATFDDLGITPGTYVYPLLQGTPDTLAPGGSSSCTSAESTITVTFGEAALIPPADCMFSSRFENDSTISLPEFYTDRETFLENVQDGFFADPYDDITQGPAGTLLQRTDGSFTYEVTAAGSGSNILFNGNGFLSTNNGNDALVITLTGVPVTAIGGNFWAVDSFFGATGNDIILSLDDGTEIAVSPSSVDGFAGFITEVPIVSISIEAPDDSNFPAADNLIVGQR